MEELVRMTQCKSSWLEEADCIEEDCHESGNVSGLYKLKKARDQSLSEAPEGMQPRHHLGFSPVRPMSDF